MGPIVNGTKNDEARKIGAFKPVEALRGGVQPSKDVEYQLWDQVELSRYSGGPVAIVVGPGGESSEGKSAIKKERCRGSPSVRSIATSERPRPHRDRNFLLLNPSPKPTHRPLVSTILLSGARAVIENQEVRGVKHKTLCNKSRC